MENLLELRRPIEELPLSKEFKYMAEINGFETMEEILSFSAASLLQKQEFSYHVYKELGDYLKENDFLYLFNHSY